jgi:hypothetical protein
MDLFDRIEEASTAELAELARHNPEEVASALVYFAIINEDLAPTCPLTFESARRDRVALATEQRSLATALRLRVEKNEAA